METAKDIFLEAAKKVQATHISVHWELNLMNHFVAVPYIREAWSKAKHLARTLQPHMIQLHTGQFSNSLMPIGPEDRSEIHPSYSAIEHPNQSAFLEENEITVSLVSGLTASKCVDETRKALINRRITPIMVTNATDLNGPPERTWGQGCLVSTVEEIEEWVREL